MTAVSCSRLAAQGLALFALLVWHTATTAAPRLAPAAEQSAAQRALAARFADSGMTNAIATYLHHPALAEAILPYEHYLSTESTLPPRHRSIVNLRTAWLTRSGYLWAHYARRARAAGLDTETLHRIAAGPDARGWTAFEQTLLRSADELHVDSFISNPTWAALSAEYDTNQIVDLIYGTGELTLHAALVNTLGVEIEPGVTDRLPSGVPYFVSARWTNERLEGKGARIPPLEPHEWSPELRQRLDPENSGRRIANVFRTFVRNPRADGLRSSIGRHIRDGSTLSPRHRELLLVRIGVLCRSEYEFAAHVRVGLQVGLTRADVERIARGPEAPGDAVDTLLLRAADEQYRDDEISAETWAALAKEFDTRQLLDIIVAVGGYRSASMAINSAGVQLDENMADFRFPAFMR